MPQKPDSKIGKLSEETIKSLPVPDAGNWTWYFRGNVLQGAKAPPGFGVRVTAAGARSFVLDYRLRGRQHRFTIGSCDTWTALKAVREARMLRQRVDRGENPLDDREPEVKGKTVGDVLDEFVIRYARPKLRGAAAVESALERLVKPRVGKLGIYDLNRRHVAEMLDKIEDTAGPVAADRTRAYFRKALGWYSERDERFNFSAAIVRVEPRSEGASRSRTLSDDELRLIWPVLAESGAFGALLTGLLLTGARRNELAGMTRGEIGKDGIWEVPAERYKTKRPHAVALSAPMLALIKAQPKGSEFVFPSSSGTAFTGFGKSKAALDAAVLNAMRKAGGKGVKSMPHWTLHDLRRTAKTLMQRAGVRPDISERVLGHVIQGVAGVYDRHGYVEEKREALEKLAEMVDRIINPSPSNVAKLPERVRTAAAR
jgi:integrase